METLAKELKALTDATWFSHDRTSTAEWQTTSLFQESSASGLQTTDLKGPEDVATPRRLAKKRTTALAGSRRALRTMKFGVGAGVDPFVHRKGVTTVLFNKLAAKDLF